MQLLLLTIQFDTNAYQLRMQSIQIDLLCFYTIKTINTT
jgi:hypothetical protein